MKKFSKPLFTLSTFLIATSHAWAVDDSSDFDHNEKAKEPKKELTQTNVPANVQKEFHEQTKDYIAAIQEQAKDIKIEPAPDEFQERINEALKAWEESVGESLKEGDYAKGSTKPSANSCRNRKDVEIFRSILRQSFETNALLTSAAQEPLFLDNKEEFSVETRPFLGYTNQHQFLQLGGFLAARRQSSEGYISGQLLYSYGEFEFLRSHAKSNDIILAFTYGKYFNDFFGGSLTFSSGYSWSDFNREYGHTSQPKAWSLGLSPILVYSLEKTPIDFFIGGDVYYSQVLKFDEHYKSKTYTYDAENDVLWRIKAGPSYTFKRSTEKRLYQLRFLLAGNVQSPILDRFTISPNLLFESQGRASRGGYLFELGLNLGKLKKSWNIAYGLRF